MSNKVSENGNGKVHSKANGTNKKHEIEQVSWLWVLAVLSCFVIVPLFVYWCWICVELHQGKLLIPSMHDLQNNFSDWLQKNYWKPILSHALPNARSMTIYTVWLAFQAFLTAFAPGPKGEGVDLGNGKKLIYKYNGQFAFMVTLITAATLHLSGLFRLSILYDEYPALLSTCLLYTTLIIGLIHIYALITGKVERPSNSLLYDYFMGPILNPRIGDFDIKFFFELRPGIMHWFFTTVAMAIKMYEDNGTISAPMALIVFYHFCFTNACYKGEQCVPFSMDIIYEKFGWMLLMLDIVMVPFIFPLQAFYLLKMGPAFTFSPLYLGLVCGMHCLGYYIFDTANSQKDYFREKEQTGHVGKKGWPILPWGELENPTYIKTERGTKLLTSGWWGKARHMNYTGDLLMAWSWALTCGVGSYFPFAYATFYLTPLLIHRERRDDDNCAKKYGADWEKYKKLVPYRLIPYVY